MPYQIYGAVIHTPEGGVGTRMTNATGAPSVKGTVVEASPTIARGFNIAGASDYAPIGVVYESGIPDGQLCFVVLHGPCELLLENNTISAPGNWVFTSTQAGRGNATLAAPPGGGIPELDQHSREVGHCLDTVNPGGVDRLCLCTVHFN